MDEVDSLRIAPWLAKKFYESIRKKSGEEKWVRCGLMWMKSGERFYTRIIHAKSTDFSQGLSPGIGWGYTKPACGAGFVGILDNVGRICGLARLAVEPLAEERDIALHLIIFLEKSADFFARMHRGCVITRTKMVADGRE